MQRSRVLTSAVDKQMQELKVSIILCVLLGLIATLTFRQYRYQVMRLILSIIKL